MNSHVNPPALEGVQVTEFIRETSVSTTWRGHQDSLDRAVFICSLNEDAATERDRFRSIARAIAKIKHPNIIHVFDVLDDASGRPCIVFEAVEGSSLQQIVGNGKHLPAAQSCDIALSLASALSATWDAASLVHRNLKPLNVTLTHEGTIKLIEFASAFLATPEGVAEAARSEELVGTPSYMSPEQITSGTDIDFRSDIYAIGALLYRFITGVAPFNDYQDPDQIMRCQLEMTLPSPRALNPKCPPALEAVIARCMMKRPEDRYASYAELIADLTKVKSGASFGDIALPAAPALSTVSVLPPPAPKPVVAKDASRPGSAANPQAATPRKSVSPALSISLYAVLVIGLLVFGAARWNVSEPATTPVSLGPLQPAVAFVQNLLKPVNSPVAVPEEDVPSTPTATEQADSEPQPSTASTTEPATEVAVSVRPDIAPEEPRPATAALTADDVDRTLNDAALALRTGNSPTGLAPTPNHTGARRISCCSCRRSTTSADAAFSSCTWTRRFSSAGSRPRRAASPRASWR